MAWGPVRSTHTISNFCVDFHPSSCTLGTTFLVCLPRIHELHFGGLDEKAVGVPVPETVMPSFKVRSLAGHEGMMPSKHGVEVSGIELLIGEERSLCCDCACGFVYKFHECVIKQ